MKRFPFFPNLLLIGIFSLSLISPGRRPAPLPPAVPLTNITAISAGSNHACAVTGSGYVKCWGDNTYGQLGDGTVTDRHTPWLVSGLSDVVAVSVGQFHSCAVTSTGGAKCWGANGYGQLGNDSNNASHVPANVSNLANAVAISAGSYHTCALTSTGAMKCWGRNYDGQLGDGTTDDQWTPATIFANGISDISAGWAHTCAVTTAGRAKCWGNNVRGQLGDGTTTERHSPANVSGLASGVASISAGDYHTCALASGSFKCWGLNNNGQLGDNSTTERHSPVNVLWLASVPSAISAGGSHTCGLNTDGGVKCWGWNFYGQLGDNSNVTRLAPVNVSGLGNGISAVSAGGSTSCALTDAGGVKCWGKNSDGQVGDGTTTNRDEPVNVDAPQLAVRSAAARDGWALESGENTDAGGSINAGGFLVVGDNAANRQYRSILYFDTSALPDNAVILRVTLKIKLYSTTGTDPFTTHGNLVADIKEGTFGAADLEASDFEAWVSNDNIGSFSAVSGAPGWYRLILAASDHAYINLTSITQFRLRFATDDNNDSGADYAAFLAGNAATSASRPVLIIEYTFP